MVGLGTPRKWARNVAWEGWPGMPQSRSTERGPIDIVVRGYIESELTWAGLPYHIWKEARKISGPPPAPMSARV